MKAVLALVLIYIGTFLVAIQGNSLTGAQAAQQNSSATQNARPASPAMDPAKEADIRSLLELVGARDTVQDSVTRAAEQYREHLLETVPNNQQGQAFVNTVITSYEKKFDVDAVTSQLAAIYDKHYTEDEIKGLLQFYGSPLGQKVAAEFPKIGHELQDVIRATSGKAVKEALQEAKQESPGVGQNAKLAGPGGRRFPQQRRAQQGSSSTAPNAQQQDAASESAQQQDPQ